MNALKLAAVAAALSGFALAPAATTAAPPPLVQAKAPQVHQGTGVVKAVDAHAGTVRLDHGPIASLGWGAMAMDFQVKDHALLKPLKPGQKVRFDLAADGPGRFVITGIAPAR